MQTTKSMEPEFPLKQSIYRRFKCVLMPIFTLACVMGAILLLADIAINNPKDVSAIRDWMVSTWVGWLAWRLMLYTGLGWGLWKIWHAPGFKPALRAPLLRMTIVSLLFILLCEYALFHRMGGSL